MWNFQQINLHFILSIVTVKSVENLKIPAKVLVRRLTIDDSVVHVEVETEDDHLLYKMSLAEDVWAKGAVFTMVGGSSEIVYKEVKEAADKLYMDKKHEAVLKIDGNKVKGMIGHDQTIENEEDKHYIYRTPTMNKVPDNNSMLLRNVMHKKLKEYTTAESQSNHRQTTSSEYVIETHAILDYDETIKFIDANGYTNYDELISFLRKFFTKVQAYFNRITRKPPIKIRLVGVTGYAKKEKEPDFIKDSHVRGNEYDIIKMHRGLKKWLMIPSSNTPNVTKFDYVYLMSGKSLGSVSDGVFSGAVDGISTKGGICHKTSKEYFSAAIGEEYLGTPYAIKIAAHELGHILGSGHDWDKGYEACRGKGYIMDDFRINKFSDCSIDVMYKKMKNAKCIKRYDTELNNELTNMIVN